jgi:septum formation protein
MEKIPPNPKIILATTSPYRKEAFEMLGLKFIAEDSNVDENFEGRSAAPEKLVGQLSKMKAESVAKNHPDRVIIGFDSVGWFRDAILEKPKSKDEALERLKVLSGNSFQFYTGVHIINNVSNQTLSRVVATNVEMRAMSESEIKKYLNQDSNFNTYALGFDPLGHLSSSFVQKIEGSYNNLLRGIPLETIVEMLKGMGIEI